jgi:hypothetical protein
MKTAQVMPRRAKRNRRRRSRFSTEQERGTAAALLAPVKPKPIRSGATLADIWPKAPPPEVAR